MRSNSHARFWIGGGEGDLFADHTGSNAHEACLSGQISWCKKSSASFLRHPLSPNFQSIHTDFDLNAVVIQRYERSTKGGKGPSGSSKCAVSVPMEFLSETGKVESKDLQNSGLPGGETHTGTTACRSKRKPTEGRYVGVPQVLCAW